MPFEPVMIVWTRKFNTNHNHYRFFQMGYAHISQRGSGLHLRQYSRAFIIENNSKRVAFVSVDGAMIAHTVKRDVSMRLPLAAFAS